MTLRDLQKAVESDSGGLRESNQQILLQKLRGKPFWNWDSYEHRKNDIKYKGACSFTHIIGLPRNDGIEKPFFNYEKLLYRALLVPDYLNSNPKLHTNDPGNIMHAFKEKHLWVLKNYRFRHNHVLS